LSKQIPTPPFLAPTPPFLAALSGILERFADFKPGYSVGEQLANRPYGSTGERSAVALLP
jgi:hypothetical protein